MARVQTGHEGRESAAATVEADSVVGAVGRGSRSAVGLLVGFGVVTRRMEAAPAPRHRPAAANRHGRMSVRGRRLQAALAAPRYRARQRARPAAAPSTRTSGSAAAARCRIDQRRRVPSPSGPRAASISMRHAVPVLAVEREASRRLERGHPRVEGRRRDRRRAARPSSRSPFDERVRGRALDADDPARDRATTASARCRRCGRRPRPAAARSSSRS